MRRCPDVPSVRGAGRPAPVALVTAETAADLVRAYDFGRHRRLLDVGGGYGTFARPILAAYEQLTATLIDLPEVASAATAQGVPDSPPSAPTCSPSRCQRGTT